MFTIKLRYSSTDEFQTWLSVARRQQSAAMRFAFNRLQEGQKQTEVRKSMKILDFKSLDSWWMQSALYDAMTFYKLTEGRKVVFGGKGNLKRYLKGLITKDEFKACKLRSLSSFGSKYDSGNRKFKLNVEHLEFTVTPKRGVKHKLTFQPQFGDRLKQLLWIQEQTQVMKLPLSVRIDETYVYLTFQPCQEPVVEKISNRVMAVDTNPNSIGWSVCDVSDAGIKVVDSGVLNLYNLNSRGKNKRRHETYQISKFLTDKAVHHKASKFCVEDIRIRPSDKGIGKDFNKACNNTWLRGPLVSNLRKRCYIHNIQIVEVNPCYSSVIGGVLHRDWPDPIAPTLELARRAHFHKQPARFLPGVPRCETLNELWKQTLGVSLGSWRKITDWLKNSKHGYRVPLTDFDVGVFRFRSKPSCVQHGFVYA